MKMIIPISLLLLGGCGRRNMTQVESAIAQVNDVWRMYSVVGVGLCVLGIGMLLFGSKSSGAVLAASGIAMSCVGDLVTRFQWLSWVCAAATLFGLGMVVYDQYKRHRKLQVAENAVATIAEAVETSDGGRSVKDQIVAMGTVAAATVDAVVDPLKARFKTPGDSAKS